jgi:serine/threonine-protein kinase
MASPRTRQIQKRVWNAGRLLVLAGALTATFGAFFLTAARVASRAREVSVPDVRGKTVQAASDAMARVGLVLKVDAQRRPDPKVPADHVLMQDPDPGTKLRRQRSVRIRVSDGLRAPSVPSVVGLAERAAEMMIVQSGATVSSRAEVHLSSREPNLIVAQDPPARGHGSAVALLINREAPEQTYVMPDLIGASASRVTEILRQRGFRVPQSQSVLYPNLPPGIVVRQSPQAGFQIGAGELITLEVTR